ncbi:MAG TPA: M20/M25/M40 family metallo-hydrolase [Fimbriimonadaceae bacterium]|nr:M20/M25/M40 family metallo-hydrolase [Fimbriimonadaceae bacterium]
MREVLAEFSRLLSIPTTVAHTEGREECARLIAAMLSKRGFATRLVEAPGAAPLVVGKLDAGADRTLALYCHYDAQPVDQPDWLNDPWTPTLYDGVAENGALRVRPDDVKDWTAHDYRVYARSTSDDKAPVQVLCSALDKLGAAPAVNLLFVVEGEEECGSPNFRQLLTQVPETDDVLGWLILDGPVHPSRRQQVIFGARGVVTLQMTIYGPTRTLHSGHYGNFVPNPAMRLVHLIASMRDPLGHVTVEGFGDAVAVLGDEEKQAFAKLPDIGGEMLAAVNVHGPEDGSSSFAEAVARPAINLHGIQAGHVQQEATNAIMQTARSSMDIRLVPDQTVADVQRAVTEHVKRQGFHVIEREPTPEELRSNEKVVRMQWGSGYEPARTPLSSEFARALIKAVGTDVLVNPMLGGSVPIRKIVSQSDVPVAILPIANHDNNQHGANENIRIANLSDGIETYARLLSSFS